MKLLVTLILFTLANTAVVNANNIAPLSHKEGGIIDMSNFYTGKTLNNLKETEFTYYSDLEHFFSQNVTPKEDTNVFTATHLMGCATTDLPSSPNCNGICESTDSSTGPDCNGICDASEPSNGSDCNGVCNTNDSSAGVDCNGICQSGDSSNGPDCNGVCNPGEPSSSPDCNGVCDSNDNSNSVDCNGSCQSGDASIGPDCNGICESGDSPSGPDCNGLCDTNDSSSGPDCNGICNVGESSNGPDCNGVCNNSDQAGSPDCDGNCGRFDTTGSPDCNGRCELGDSSSGVDCDGRCDLNDSANGADCDGFCHPTDHPLSPDCNTILPIELSDFKVWSHQCNHELSWQTFSEINFLGFEIEQASKNRKFKTIQFIPNLEGNQVTKEYQFTVPNANFDAFYRLKLIDLDESNQYSSTISIGAACPSTITIRPNPTYDYVDLTIDETEAQNIFLTVTNTLGQRMLRLNLSNDNSSNTTSIDISQYPPGPYYFTIQQNSTTQNIKVIKL